MSATEALKVARAAGIRLDLDGDDLVLEASAPPPLAVLDLLSHNKSAIVALLRPADDGWMAADWRALFVQRAQRAESDGELSREEAETRAFESCLGEWMNRHPDPSEADRCAWCGRHDETGHAVVPFGVDHGHTWLHSTCWAPWHSDRRRKAKNALARMGFWNNGQSPAIGKIDG